MKKISFFLLLLLSIISCRSIDSNANNYQADFQRESDENTFLFTLNYPYSGDRLDDSVYDRVRDRGGVVRSFRALLQKSCQEVLNLYFLDLESKIWRDSATRRSLPSEGLLTIVMSSPWRSPIIVDPPPSIEIRALGSHPNFSRR